MSHDRRSIQIKLRLVSVLLMAAAFGALALRPCTMIVQWERHAKADWLVLWDVFARAIRYYELPWAVTLIVVAGALWLLQRPLARLIVPRAGAMCPECGYSLRGIQATRCPECGSAIKQIKPESPSG